MARKGCGTLGKPAAPRKRYETNGKPMEIRNRQPRLKTVRFQWFRSRTERAGAARRIGLRSTTRGGAIAYSVGTTQCVAYHGGRAHTWAALAPVPPRRGRGRPRRDRGVPARGVRRVARGAFLKSWKIPRGGEELRGSGGPAPPCESEYATGTPPFAVSGRGRPPPRPRHASRTTAGRGV